MINPCQDLDQEGFDGAGVSGDKFRGKTKKDMNNE